MIKRLQLGINEDFTNAEYHADTSFISSSGLKLLLDDPEQFYTDVIMGQKEPMSGNHLDIGSCVHTLLLEPHMLEKEFAIAHDCFQKRGKAWATFVEANEGNGKTLMSASMYEQAVVFAASVKARPEALEKLKGGRSELSICAMINDVPVKMRADYIVPRQFINDIKTTSEPGGASYFRETIKQWDYDLSAALYKLIADQHYNANHDWYWTVISKEERVTDLYKASEKTLQKGLQDVYKALEIYKQCMTSGIWKSAEKPEAPQNYVVQEI